MKHRCYSPKNDSYKHYGARGIKVCDEWLNDFMNFYNWAIGNGYKEGLTIDRVDVNGNYKPSNCRWVTMKKQQNNRSNNHYVMYENKKYTISELAELNNMDRNLLNKRIRRGWDINKAISKEVKQYEKKKSS